MQGCCITTGSGHQCTTNSSLQSCSWPHLREELNIELRDTPAWLI